MQNKRGQVTIFVIVGIVIIVLGLVVFLFAPQISDIFTGGSKDPNSFLQNCIEKDLKKAVEKLSMQGGSLAPEHFILYRGNPIEYLCYTEEYYKTCVMQRPMIKNHVKEEIKNSIKNTADSCLEELKKSYQAKGYSVQLSEGRRDVELLPGKILLVFNNTIILSKEATESQKYFVVSIDNNIYELLSIAESILNWEASYGDAETTLYMNYYHDLKVEKLKQSDGTTIYILTDRKTGDKFQFASRSIPWPPGFAVGQITTG